MSDALSVDGGKGDYYRFRKENDDGNYLYDLAATCREVLGNVSIMISLKKNLLELCQYYCDLQVHKHVIPEDRVPRLINWFDENKQHIPEMEWYEFSACSGSTLRYFLSCFLCHE